MRGVSVPANARRALEAARRAGVPFGEAWPAVLDAMEDDQWREKGLMPDRPRRR
jgi:hypothetical protein